MSLAHTKASGTLAHHLVPRTGVLSNQAVFATILVVAGALFVALLAQIRFYLPFTPVPIVASTMGVLLVGSLLGTRLGTVSMLVYLALGAIGLPFFTAGNSGIVYMQGATLGYLAAYPVVAAAMGWLAERGWDRSLMTNVLALIIGSLIFYVLGAGWLIAGMGLSVGAALTQGVVPFLIGDAVKIAIIIGVLPSAWHLLGSDKKRS